MADRTRVQSIDSLRGLAALSVIAHHISQSFPIFYAPYAGTFFQQYAEPTLGNRVVYYLSYTPLHLLWGGHEAVILFFVLSGFVLAMPFLHDAVAYRPYLIKRVCRIYIPYILVVTVSALLMSLLSPAGIPELSDWFNRMWAEPVSWRLVVDHLFMLGNTTVTLDGSTWSLVHEMRISLIFPALMLVVKRGWRSALALAFALSSLSFVANKLLPLPINLWETVHYSALFVVGALLAQYRTAIAVRVAQLSRTGTIIYLIAAMLLLNWRWELVNMPILHRQRVFEWAIASGALMLIAFVLGSRRADAALRRPSFLWLGKISYSLYLEHMVVLLTLTYGLHNVLPVAWIMLMVPAVSLVFAGALYRWVEEPTILLGRKLASSDNPQRKSAHIA